MSPIEAFASHSLSLLSFSLLDSQPAPMYRTAARKALFLRRGGASPQFLGRAAVDRCPRVSTSTGGCQSATSKPIPIHPQAKPETPYYVDSTATHPPPPSSSAAGSEEGKSRERKRVVLGYQEEQARVLSAALPHVKTLGWSEAAMIAGAKEVGLSPAILGSFPRKGAALVEYFMDDCLQRLIDIIDSGEDLNGLIPSERVSKLVRLRLEMQAPYISKWAEALAIQAQPLNVPTSFKQRAILIDEVWHAVGDESSDVDWYVKRTVLGGIYSTTEVYMLTDSSPGFRDTWVFLNNRVKDAFDLKKTFQEASYLAEAVSAGVGSSLQGFVKTVLRG